MRRTDKMEWIAFKSRIEDISVRLSKFNKELEKLPAFFDKYDELDNPEAIAKERERFPNVVRSSMNDQDIDVPYSFGYSAADGLLTYFDIAYWYQQEYMEIEIHYCLDVEGIDLQNGIISKEAEDTLMNDPCLFMRRNERLTSIYKDLALAESILEEVKIVASEREEAIAKLEEESS